MYLSKDFTHTALCPTESTEQFAMILNVNETLVNGSRKRRISAGQTPRIDSFKITKVLEEIILEFGNYLATGVVSRFG